MFLEKIDGLGRVHIPKEIRKLMGVSEGSVLKLRFDCGYLFMKEYKENDNAVYNKHETNDK